MKENGMRLKEALGLVIRARPQVCPDRGFLEYLRELKVELFHEEIMPALEELPRQESDRLGYFKDNSKSETTVK
jgi:atypical dual specificity phosphatase